MTKSYTAAELKAKTESQKSPPMQPATKPATKHATKHAAKTGNGFVNAEELLTTLFPSEKSRPSARWLRDRTQAGDVPSVKLGGLTFYDAAKVRAVLNGEAPPLTEAQLASMSEPELWVHYEGILKTKGASHARAFYLKHIKDGAR